MKQFSLAILAAMLIVSASLTSTMVSAAELNYYGIETIIEKTLLVRTTTTLIADSPISHLDYNLDFNVLNLSVTTSSGANRCSFENFERDSSISCDFYGMDEGENNIQLTFTTRNAVRRVGDNYEFRSTYPIAMPTKKMFSIIRLPQKGLLAGEVANQSFFPPDGKVLSDGKNIIISWEKKNLTKSDTLSFSVLFEVGEAGGILWDMSIIGLTIVVVIAMALVGIYMRRGGRPPAEREVRVLPLLNKDEKRIVDIIVKYGGEARQRALVKDSDFSKAKISRMVKNLKERGVIDIEPISGRENKVILKIKGVE
jgi:uncharacterized membrane protein